MKQTARRLPVDFTHLHRPKSALALVYATHVAYPATLIALLATVVATHPPPGSIEFAWVISAISWAILVAAFLHSRRLGPAQVWRDGLHLEAKIVSAAKNEDSVEARIRFDAGGISRISTVTVPGQQWPDWEPHSLTVAFLPGHEPVFVSIVDPWSSQAQPG
jgi:hypothetical protein